MKTHPSSAWSNQDMTPFRPDLVSAGELYWCFLWLFHLKAAQNDHFVFCGLELP